MSEKQSNFESNLARELKRDPHITEPKIWFKQVILAKSLGGGIASNNVIRTFTLKAGLNILWAEPEVASTEPELYQDGTAGHSTGKTLFCRILRHLLGEPKFGTKVQREQIQDTFPSLWAIAHIRLNSKSWIIGRCLTNQLDTSFAFQGDDINTVLSKSPDSFTGHQEFTDEVSNICANALSEIYPENKWRQLLPWLARDQEARFTDITAWRHTLSEADSPQISKEDKHQLMQTMLDLYADGETKLRQEIQSDKASLTSLTESIPKDKNILSTLNSDLKHSLSKINGLKVNISDLDAVKKRITEEASKKKLILENDKNLSEPDHILRKQQAYDGLQDRKIKITIKITELSTQRTSLIKEQREDSKLIEKIKHFDQINIQRLEEGFCPHRIEKAQALGCVSSETKKHKEPENLVQSLKEKENIIKDQLKIKAIEIEQKKHEEKQVNLQLEDAKKELSTLRKEATFHSSKISRDLTTLEQAEDFLRKSIKQEKQLTYNEKLKEQIETGLAKKERDVRILRNSVKQKILYLSDIYSDVLQATLGSSVKAKIQLGEKKLLLHVTQGKELGGAALETIKYIAFDIASVILSVEGRSHHPRFLIHDGPREADMAEIIYNQIFNYMEYLENQFGNSEPSFQYILTTTTPPPVRMQTGSKWLICDKLNGSTEQGRLLKQKF